MKLVLIRHGQIDANVSKIYAGRSDDPLNETGRAQAVEVARQLSPTRFEALYSSPLRRTMETANIIGQHISCQPIASEAFNELIMGPWEGLDEAKVAREYPNEFTIWTSRPAELEISGRETLLELQKRAVSGVHDIQRQLPDTAHVIIVSHVAVIRTIILYSEGKNLNEYKQVHVPNASPIHLEITSRNALKESAFR